ncbi:MAG TPA: transaldolase [Thermomicrobiales bacterium]|jgi:transaldolase
MAMAAEGTVGARERMAALLEQGQSVWLDYITRDLVRNGGLKREIEEFGLRGMTSNPTIFQKAISEGHAYDEQVAGLMRQGASATVVFESVAIKDIQDACDLFRPLYDSTNGGDGFVSIEVSPLLALDTQGTVEEARRLWASVDRPNVMIKVPGTVEGAPAVQTLLTEGMNVNVTLLFSLESHERVMWAYIEALEARAAKGQPIDRIGSVASFFVSRVDTAVDKLIDAKVAELGAESAEGKRVQGLRGKVAVANAKLAYARFREIFGDERFGKLAALGASPQRPLWASTGTKDKAYPDTLYVDSLIGPDTVNTLPPATLEAFRDHGTVARTIDEGVDAARATMATLKEVGIDIDAVTKGLEEEGVASFAKSFDDLLSGVEAKRQDLKATAQ